MIKFISKVFKWALLLLIGIGVGLVMVWWFSQRRMPKSSEGTNVVVHSTDMTSEDISIERIVLPLEAFEEGEGPVLTESDSPYSETIEQQEDHPES